MTLMTLDDVESYGGTGNHGEDDITLAIDLAEFDIGHAMNTFLEPTTVALEEHMWPWNDGRIMLLKKKAISITTVIAKHSLDNDCVWEEDTECGVILDDENGLIFVRATNLSLSSDCNCGTGTAPDRAVITYVAGFTAAELASTTLEGKAIRMAINLRMREWLTVLEENDYWQGQFLIKGFSSMDYSEQRDFLAQNSNPLGPGPMSEAAWRILQRIKPYPAIMIRSSGRI